MKKNKISLVILFMVLLFSCKQTTESPAPIENTKNKPQTKQAYKPTNYNGVKNNGEYLSFDTREDFENLLSLVQDDEEVLHFEKIMGNKSRKQLYEKNSLEDTIVLDDNFSAMLSENNMIQISNHIYNLDFENKIAYVLHENDISEINALKNKDTLNLKIKYFSDEYEVISLIEDGFKRDPKLVLEKFGCRDRRANRRKSTGNITYGMFGDYNSKCKLAYQPLFIVFSLTGKMVNRYNSGFGWYNQYGHSITMRYNQSHTHRCRSRVVNSDEIATKSNYKLVFRPYQSTRALRNYSYQCLFTNFSATTAGGGAPVYLEINN